MTKPTDDMLRLAREIGFSIWMARYRSGSHIYTPDPNHEKAVNMLYLLGQCDTDDAIQAALAAISQTTELATELATVFTAHSRESLIVKALEDGDHLKQQEAAHG